MVFCKENCIDLTILFLGNKPLGEHFPCHAHGSLVEFLIPKIVLIHSGHLQTDRQYSIHGCSTSCGCCHRPQTPCRNRGICTCTQLSASQDRDGNSTICSCRHQSRTVLFYARKPGVSPCRNTRKNLPPFSMAQLPP